MRRRIPILVATGVLGGVATYSISGTVYDADGSTAVSGATVALGAYTADSGGDGTYTISGIPAGTSGSMTCTKTGYSWTAISVAAMSGNLTGQDYTNAWWAGAGASGICVGAYIGKGASSLANSYVNLKNPGTYDLTTTDAPTWSADDGWTFNGSSDHLDTGIVIADAQSWSFLVQVQGATNNGASIGCASSSGVSIAGARPDASASGVRYLYGSSASAYVDVLPVITTGAGNLMVAGRNCYRDGVSDGTIPASTPGNTYATMGLGGIHLTTGSYSTWYSGKVQCGAIYNDILSAPQAAMIYAGIVAQGFFLAP